MLDSLQDVDPIGQVTSACPHSQQSSARHSFPLQGPNDHTIAQIKDAVRDGLRAVKNTIDDAAVVPGAGAYEIAAANHLRSVTVKTAEGR